MVKGYSHRPWNAASLSTPLAEWPASDRNLFQNALRGGDPYSEAGRGAGWAAATRIKYTYDYGNWLSWLSRSHPHLLDLDPGKRVSTSLIEEYRQHLAARLRPKSVACRLSGLGSMLWALCETDEFAWVQLAAQRLSQNAVGRNKRGLVPPSTDLADLGFELMTEAEAGKAQGPYPPAVRYRNGLIIALLASCPIRRRNLAMIEIGRHFTEYGDGFRLEFAAEETKQKHAISYVVAGALVPAFKRYLRFYRPILLVREPFRGRAGNALWVGADGDRLKAEGIYRATTEYTKPKFGHGISPHRFRDSAATTISTEKPEHIQDVRAVLGHSTLRTSERHYNQAGTIEASRAYHEVLRVLRRRRIPLRHRKSEGHNDS